MKLLTSIRNSKYKYLYAFILFVLIIIPVKYVMNFIFGTKFSFADALHEFFIRDVVLFTGVTILIMMRNNDIKKIRKKHILIAVISVILYVACATLLYKFVLSGDWVKILVNFAIEIFIWLLMLWIIYNSSWFARKERKQNKQ